MIVVLPAGRAPGSALTEPPQRAAASRPTALRQGHGRAIAAQPQPTQGVPVPSAGYGSLAPGSPADPSGGFPDDVQLTRSGKKIKAIKQNRQYTNVGRKEAKDFAGSL